MCTVYTPVKTDMTGWKIPHVQWEIHYIIFIHRGFSSNRDVIVFNGGVSVIIALSGPFNVPFPAQRALEDAMHD